MMLKFCSAAVLTIAFSVPLLAETPQREQVGEVLGKPVYRDQFQSAKGHSNRCDALRGLFLTPLWEQLRAQHAEHLNVSEVEIQAYVTYHQRKLLKDRSDVEEELKQVKSKLAGSGLDKMASQELSDRKGELEYCLQCFERQAEQKQKAEREFDEFDQQFEDSLPRFLRIIAVELHRPRNGISRFDRHDATFVISNWKEEHFLYHRYGGDEFLERQFGIEALDARRKWIEECEAKGDFKIADSQVRKMLYEYWTTQLETVEANEKFLRPQWRELLVENSQAARNP